MIIILHVLAALSSIGQATFLLFKPSAKGLHIAYGLVALTLVSGTFLVVSSHSALLSACLAGLAYLGGVSLALIIAGYRLAKQLQD